ncbi:hypothetical protein AAFF_G00113790 [Aldrovandia affinis]|uniref:Uncharacterized protein n=1 Tax=Aldrovandia affinis TaxID=143900 RepID=A0AAD7WAY6_9TELE|nr:hypothetical protein AAFF_G00113790 [Aldrovandia affinis]
MLSGAPLTARQAPEPSGCLSGASLSSAALRRALRENGSSCPPAPGAECRRGSPTGCHWEAPALMDTFLFLVPSSLTARTVSQSGALAQVLERRQKKKKKKAASDNQHKHESVLTRKPCSVHAGPRQNTLDADRPADQHRRTRRTSLDLLVHPHVSLWWLASKQGLS